METILSSQAKKALFIQAVNKSNLRIKELD